MFIGFVLFVLVFLMAFWLMVFLFSFLPFWIGAYFIDLFNGDKAIEQEES